MTDRPKIEWSYSELKKAWEDAANNHNCESTLRNFVNALGAVSAAEAREREREVWMRARAAYWPLFSIGLSAFDVSNVDASRDKEYPSLLPASPPPLVLSTGTWTRDRESFWERKDDPFPTRTGILPTRTASDAEKLAAWLRAYGSTEEAK